MDRWNAQDSNRQEGRERKRGERGCETKSGEEREEEMQMGMFLWALRKDLGVRESCIIAAGQ